MKKLIVTISIGLVGVASAISQNDVDAMRYSQLTFGGTARFASMAGSMGALGGDISSLSFNPAGIAIFKKTELSITPSLFSQNTSSTYNGMNSGDRKLNFNLGNIGLVASIHLKEDNESGWKSLNFGFGYNRTNNFNNRISIIGNNKSSSLLDTYVGAANGHLSSDFAFSLPAKETVYGRYYLLLGGYDAIKRLAEDLDHSLAPFGRIELNRIEDDTRTVTISGWALDNKEVSGLELWIDDKKISDLAFNSQRADICQLYPGYSMCSDGHSRIGFETTYRRPEGNGCAQAVEVRARDSDGNVRTIGRKSITPVVY